MQMSGYIKVSDPYRMAIHLGRLVPPPAGTRLGGNINTRNQHIIISASHYEELERHLNLPDAKVVRTATLNSSNGAALSHILENRGSMQLPWILGPASALPVVGNWITLYTSTVDGIDRLANRSRSGTITAAQLAVLMADGGRILRTWAFTEDSTHGRLLVTECHYAVQVASESRIYPLYSDMRSVLSADS
jgi:hypothetical protein